MSDGGSGEKTEEPTPERLRKLREDGNIPKSADVTSAVKFLTVFCTLSASFHYLSDEIMQFTLLCIDIAVNRGEAHRAFFPYALMLQGLITMFKAIAPAVGVEFVTAIVVSVAQVGFLFTTKPITPDFNKVNPINGLKNLFNMKKIVELLKTIIKFVLIGYLSYYSLRNAIRDVTLILRSDLFVGVTIVGDIIANFILKIGGVFLIIAAADLFYQRKRYTKDNQMSKYDVKQEYKQSEGDPHHKSERRRMHQEILQGGGGSAVKGADVVVKNPTHIAVALKYDKENKGAPTVVARGERLWAEKILDAAKEYGVPVVRNVPLAQALNKIDVGDEIPEDLYQAVAEVLTFVYQLAQEQKNKRRNKG